MYYYTYNIIYNNHNNKKGISCEHYDDGNINYPIVIIVIVIAVIVCQTFA